jgi:hypothetical protein
MAIIKQAPNRGAPSIGEEAVKAMSLAIAMVLPLATSVALSTAPAASAATPTKAAFSQSVDRGHFDPGRVGRGVDPGFGGVGDGFIGFDPRCFDDSLGFRHGGIECND